MRRIVSPAALIACLLLASCGGDPTTVTTKQNSNSAPSSNGLSGAAPSSNLGVIPSHGSGAGNNAASSGAATSDKAPVATPELDAKIEKAAAKAKASDATAADKKAAADAYFERANFYRDKGMPVLYKFALADYRHGLRLDPSNEDARDKMEEIISIYKSLGRPVPDNGLEN
jgi:hypothetical protein